MLTPDKTTFKRAQTDDPTGLTFFFSIDGTDALGRPTESPWQAHQATFTPEESAMIDAMVARERQAFCDKINADLAAASTPVATDPTP